MCSSSNSKITDVIKVSQHLCIPFQDIKEATKDFTTPIIGQGGYGLVYKGELLLSGKLTSVAVKRLDSELSGQGLKEFLTEIHLLSRYKHPNLVFLLGFCEEHGEKILVYNYAEGGSLDKYLTKGISVVQLTWLQRVNICIDAARGLDYLHNHVAQDQRIIHRDIKSANILVSHDWKAMIADFGLSLIGRANENVTFIITNVSGTYGYCDPAYMHTGVLTKESDVYSFGVVLFEVLCGRLAFINMNSEQRFLAPLAQSYYNEGRLDEIIDPYLKTEVDSSSLNMFSSIAYQCLLSDRKQRPSMGLVLQKLEEMMLYKPFTNDEVPADGKDENMIEKAPEGTPADGGLLVVRIHQAENLEGKYHMNPSVRVLFRGEESITKPVKKNRDPIWGEEFAFTLEEPPMKDRIHFEVVSTSSKIGLIHPKETLGYMDIQLADVVQNKKIKGKYNLTDSRNGTLQVELQWRSSS